MDRWTDVRTNWKTDRRKDPFIEMRGRILKEKDNEGKGIDELDKEVKEKEIKKRKGGNRHER